MNRSEEISKFIVDNIMTQDIIGLADEKFNLTSNELNAMKIASKTLAPIKAMLNVFDCYGAIGRDGLAIIEQSKKVKLNIVDNTANGSSSESKVDGDGNVVITIKDKQ